jgi:hypothetical protein
MFNWGMDPGGRRWQEFLAEPGHAYIEIQGGLAQTQGEYVAMPAGADWSWLEAYGVMEADPRQVHGNDWPAAFGSVENELERRLPRRTLDEELRRSSAVADQKPLELLHHGSGWGALERLRRERAGEKPFASAALVFPDETLGQEQSPWRTLLETGELPSRKPTEDPGSLMVQPEWRELLERAVREHRGGHWLWWYHLGVMRYRAGDVAGAREAYQRSLRDQPSAWAQRDLAVLARDEGDMQRAANQWVAASRLAPHVLPLTIEAARALLAADRAQELLTFTDSLPPPVRSHGRIRLLRAMASLALDDLDAVARYFAEGDVDIANIREKETSLSDLWFGWQMKRVARERGLPMDDTLRQLVRREFPPPPKFDFRLNADRS